MIPELEKPKILEIKVRMDCNGCVQKIKKALYGINGIYDIYIDFPQQKLTIVGWADPDRIMKAIKKTRKIATICSESEQADPLASTQLPDNPLPSGGEAEAPPPSHDVAMVDGLPGHSHVEIAPGQTTVHEAHSGQQFDLTNATVQATQPLGSHEVGQVHVTHNQPSEHGHVVHQSSLEPGVVHHLGPEPGQVVSHQPENSHVVHQLPEHGHVGHQQSPMNGYVVHQHQPEHSHVVSHHQPPDHGHVINQQPPEHSHGHVIHHHPTEHTHGHVVQHHQSEQGHGRTSSHNYHHNIPRTIHGSTSTHPMTVIHSYNTYQPSPYVTEYIRPLTTHKPSPYAYEYIPQQSSSNHYSPRMDRYNDDYNNTGISSNNNGNITSIFSDENPNACNLM
ncbi:Heavy metal-associated isoprenylated plant protein 28 [Cucurbita argyrosperma subsp. argyrosperma]|nr:Heavy metal-associated isoprenylated plant protein 28 [Cucurbita argyrosperma subsp. argyrosperma]